MKTIKKYDISSIEADSFAIIDGEKKYTNPFYFDVTPTFDNDGVIHAHVNCYNNESVDDLDVTVDYHFPPYYPFYLVTYKLKNTGETERTLNLLSYFRIPEVGDYVPKFDFIFDLK